jgi:hypothetical protein
MKKVYSLLLFMLMAFAVGSYAQGEELALSPGWNCSKDVSYEGPSYPANITMLAGDNYVYANQTINADDFVGYKIVFGEAVAEGQLLLTIEGDHMTKISQPVAAGTTELNGTFEDIEFTEDDEGNIDRTISTADTTLTNDALFDTFEEFNRLEVYKHPAYATVYLRNTLHPQGVRIGIGVFGMVISTVYFSDLVLDLGPARGEYNEPLVPAPSLDEDFGENPHLTPYHYKGNPED